MERQSSDSGDRQSSRLTKQLFDSHSPYTTWAEIPEDLIVVVNNARLYSYTSSPTSEAGSSTLFVKTRDVSLHKADRILAELFFILMLLLVNHVYSLIM